MSEQHPRRPSSSGIDHQTAFEEVEHVVDVFDVAFCLGRCGVRARWIVEHGVESEDHLAQGLGRIERDRVQVRRKRPV